MAYETEKSNIIGPTDVLADGAAAALVQSIVVVPLINATDLPVGTDTKKFMQEGSLTSQTAISESATYNFDAGSEYTESSVSLTAAKDVVISKVTVEALKFKRINPARIAQLQGQALARGLDDAVLALTPGFSGGVTATSILTTDDVVEAVYVVNSGLAGLKGQNLRGIIDYKGQKELIKELKNSGALAWSHADQISLLKGLIAPNGYVGSLPGVDLFATDGLPTTGGDDVGLVFNPESAFAAMYDTGVSTEMVWVGSGGLYWEITSYVFNKVAERVDAAGARLRSDT